MSERFQVGQRVKVVYPPEILACSAPDLREAFRHVGVIDLAGGNGGLCVVRIKKKQYTVSQEYLKPFQERRAPKPYKTPPPPYRDGDVLRVEYRDGRWIGAFSRAERSQAIDAKALVPVIMDADAAAVKFSRESLAVSGGTKGMACS